jgi:predicted nucleotide-binding protein
MSKETDKIIRRKMPDIPRTEWPDRLLLALVEEYSKVPETVFDSESHHERFGVSPRRMGVAAGLVPSDGIKIGVENAWLAEVEQARQDLISAGLAEYFLNWDSLRPTRKGIAYARRLMSLGQSSAMAAANTKPTLFLGSSREALDVVTALNHNLDRVAHCKSWPTIFEPSSSTMEDLVAKFPTFQFAVFILQADDLRVQENRGRQGRVARDNVIFELGLAIGFLGRRHVFMVTEREIPLDLPTDLLGVTPITFERHPDGDLKASLFSAAGEIALAIKRESSDT